MNIDELLLDSLSWTGRTSDSLLYASSDLVGPLRHAMLRAAGAPRKPEKIRDYMRRETGNLWHNRLERAFAGQLIMREVRLSPYLPGVWGGRADWIFWEGWAFRVGDLKTTSSRALPYIERDGVKEEHLWQLSAYHWVLVEIGLPMHSNVVVYYLPTDGEANPVTAYQEPVPKDVVWRRMEERDEALKRYLESLGPNPTDWVTPELAPPPERTLEVRKNGEVMLAPHWSTRFCPYDEALCPCSLQRPEKVGAWQAEGDHWLYYPRSGYEQFIEQVPEPRG